MDDVVHNKIVFAWRSMHSSEVDQQKQILYALNVQCTSLTTRSTAHYVYISYNIFVKMIRRIHHKQQRRFTRAQYLPFETNDSRKFH